MSAPRRALVVDDAPEMRHLVGAAVAGAGFHVTTAVDGEAAVREARLHRPDLIVLDLGLPDIDGVEACRRIRAFSDAFVLILSGRTDDVDIVTGLAAGADDFVAKPCSPATLRARLRALDARFGSEPAAALGVGVEQLPLVDLLRRTLDRPVPTEHGLVVHHQPKLDVRTRRPVGVEALVRFDHPDGTRLPPDRFIGLAEHAGLMADLTASVLGAAVADLARWRRRGLGLGIAVNISTSDLGDGAFVQQVRDVLAVHAVPARALTLEVTEDHLMEDRPRALAVLGELRAAGVRIAIDDYGTGRASLAYLRDLPADELKLDRTFVAGLADDRRLGRIVASTVDLAHDLGLSVVAEGVDREEDLAVLDAVGVDTVQGFLFSPGLPADELATWCADRLVAALDLRTEAGPELRDGLTPA